MLIYIIYVCVYVCVCVCLYIYKLDLNMQVTYIYCASNISKILFVCNYLAQVAYVLNCYFSQLLIYLYALIYEFINLSIFLLLYKSF